MKDESTLKCILLMLLWLLSEDGGMVAGKQWYVVTGKENNSQPRFALHQHI